MTGSKHKMPFPLMISVATNGPFLAHVTRGLHPKSSITRGLNEEKKKNNKHRNKPTPTATITKINNHEKVLVCHLFSTLMKTFTLCKSENKFRNIFLSIVHSATYFHSAVQSIRVRNRNRKRSQLEHT